MTQQLFMEVALRALYVAAIVGGPALVISLLVGLIISIFQAVTQINEATLTFIPKIVAIMLCLIMLGPWMLNSLIDYTASILLNLARYAR
ncbi:MAG: flagellar biosynthesis protein FliQ [Cyanobacteria bacterium NC_groundwater_1444_Ag_S-0.65um_54_12]|nr:flagellar biosynthesis protein FliQ [Cyanobacteria bacterium NC_groundwater_1444_Ag_S-0.65um_54_12]